jgi:UDP-glucose 4-epimerase
MPIPESAALEPVSPYGVFKLQAEMLCRDYSRLFGVSSVAVRPFSVYGPGLRKQLLWDACRKFASAKPLFDGDGSEVRDWLHVEDLAALIAQVAGRPQMGFSALNAGSGRGAAVRDIVAMVADNFASATPPRFSGSPRPGDPQAYVADIASARALGWSPSMNLAEGVSDYVRWFRTA